MHAVNFDGGSRALRSCAWALAGVLLACLVSPALAQYAPAGNEHPESAMVDEASGDLPNPFGEANMIFERRPTAAQKNAFYRSVDLEPLRRLAVLHNGRVKILDTLAMETVETITGRRAYQDVLPTGDATSDGTDGGYAAGDHASGHLHTSIPAGERVELVAHDPLFTLLDLIIDPVYYVDRPLLHVNYLPLRRAFLEAAFPGDGAMQSRWMRLTRITPMMAQRFGPELEERHAFNQPYRDALSNVRRGLGLWDQSASNMRLVAPEYRGDTWHHLSELAPDHPARTAASELGRAWRAMDPAAVNEAARRLAEILPTVNSELYPTQRAELEHLYNRSGAFTYGYWAYFLATVALVLAFGTGRSWLTGLGTGLFVLGLLLHAFGFVLRCIIAERFAIQNQFESMTGVSLFAGVVGLGLAVARKQPLFAAAASATGFLILIAATETGIPGRSIEREAAILNTSVLLKYHVTTVLVSYGLIGLGFIISLFYLGTHYARRVLGASRMEAVSAAALEGGRTGTGRAGETLAPRETKTTARTLADLDTALMTVLQLAFWTLGVGILLGAWWADHSWGRWWAFDPKETWALITWIVYLIVIHLRFTTGKNKALITAWLSVIGFFVMLWTYFGVNLLLPGLHAYA
ncbi:MAG: hypothetical protein EA378_01890 [Phycisphaerales bacterium]|nr:MAG: hypothetical protein EA378_01890 [Phycisphaerales bacterium]